MIDFILSQLNQGYFKILLLQFAMIKFFSLVQSWHLLMSLFHQGFRRSLRLRSRCRRPMARWSKRYNDSNFMPKIFIFWSTIFFLIFSLNVTCYQFAPLCLAGLEYSSDACNQYATYHANTFGASWTLVGPAWYCLQVSTSKPSPGKKSGMGKEVQKN